MHEKIDIDVEYINDIVHYTISGSVNGKRHGFIHPTFSLENTEDNDEGEISKTAYWKRNSKTVDVNYGNGEDYYTLTLVHIGIFPDFVPQQKKGAFMEGACLILEKNGKFVTRSDYVGRQVREVCEV